MKGKIIIQLLTQVASDKDKRKWLYIIGALLIAIITLPFMILVIIIVIIIFMISGSSDYSEFLLGMNLTYPQDVIFDNAKSSITEEYEIQNDVNIFLLQSLYIIHSNIEEPQEYEYDEEDIKVFFETFVIIDDEDKNMWFSYEEIKEYMLSDDTITQMFSEDVINDLIEAAKEIESEIPSIQAEKKEKYEAENTVNSG